MPNYNSRSKSGSEPDQPDQPIGSFLNRDIALDALNQSIAGDGKETGNAQLTIGSFAFEDSGLNTLCSVEYYLVDNLNGNEVQHRLFPKNNLQFNPMKTTNAKGSFG
jgi:hypothetical protein